MAALDEGGSAARAVANLEALKLTQMASLLPDYVRLVADGERDFCQALAEMTRVEVAARERRVTNQRIGSSGFPYIKTLADFDANVQAATITLDVDRLRHFRQKFPVLADADAFTLH